MTTTAAETPDERLARQHAMLKRLAELGMAVAESAARRALAVESEPADTSTDAGHTFNRAARVVRMAMALEARLDAWAVDLERKRRALDSEKAADTRREHIHRAKREVIGQFRAVVELGAHPEYFERAERLMETDGYDDDLFELPFEEALTRIATDLGGKPDPLDPEEPADPPADPSPEYDLSAEALAKADPMRGANGIDMPAPAAAAPAARPNGHDPP